MQTVGLENLFKTHPQKTLKLKMMHLIELAIVF